MAVSRLVITNVADSLGVSSAVGIEASGGEAPGGEAPAPRIIIANIGPLATPAPDKARATGSMDSSRTYSGMRITVVTGISHLPFSVTM